jgi:2-dehydro-3-deoxyphosphooctonate aldolase (KDO 8-P synthase)
VNVKKGQWVQPEAMAGAVEKVRSGGSRDLAVTERGTFFGYGDLVVDMRNFARLREATGVAVIFDATHSVQQPGQGAGGASGGQREHIPQLLAAAAVAGAQGFFIETHPDPARAASDAATQWPLDRLDDLLERTLDLWARARDRALAPGA